MTIRRLLELHACPVLYIRVSHASCAGASTSLLSTTISASEPPSSSTDCFRLLLASAPMIAPHPPTRSGIPLEYAGLRSSLQPDHVKQTHCCKHLAVARHRSKFVEWAAQNGDRSPHALIRWCCRASSSALQSVRLDKKESSTA